nr:photosystem I assembly protein Ycf4, chloroplast [Tanacetum cinerariifolium]
MRSSSSSSSRSKYQRYIQEEVLARTHCDCPLPIEKQVAGTITNPRRRFKGCLIFDEDAKCNFYGFFDDELPSDYYKQLFFKLHEENKMLKKNLGKNMYKNIKKSNNSDEGCILEMGELKKDLTLIKSRL